MEKNYLENAKEVFLYPTRESYYGGRSSDLFNDLIVMIGYIIPNKITAEELIVYLKFLMKDIKDKTCRFNHSQTFKDCFHQFIRQTSNFEMVLSWLPGFVKEVTTVEFYDEFIELFKSSFYHLEANNENQKDYGCIEIEKDLIDISNKDKAEVLASLYNHSKPIGMGIIQYDPTPMTIEQARGLLETQGYSYDYLKGRTMKVNLSGDTVYVAGYNRDNAQDNLAQQAIAKCRNISKENHGKHLIK